MKTGGLQVASVVFYLTLHTGGCVLTVVCGLLKWSLMKTLQVDQSLLPDTVVIELWQKCLQQCVFQCIYLEMRFPNCFCVGTLTLCKSLFKPTKYFRVFRETHICVRGLNVTSLHKRLLSNKDKGFSKPSPSPASSDFELRPRPHHPPCMVAQRCPIRRWTQDSGGLGVYPADVTRRWSVCSLWRTS